MISTLLRAPLAQFLGLGALVFAAHAAIDDTPAPTPPERIVIDEAVVARLRVGFEATWRRPPTEAEMDSLIEDHLREEVLVREALALGLDRDDTVVRRRLRQKMEFLIGSAAPPEDVEDAVLKAHFEAHPDRYRRPGAVAFAQVYLGERASAAEAEATLKRLRTGATAEREGEPLLLPSRVTLLGRYAIDAQFGLGFYETLEGLETGAWVGPVRSGFGLHLVRIERRVPPSMPAFEDVRDRVIEDWAEAESRRVAEARYREMRARYEVERLTGRPDASGERP